MAAVVGDSGCWVTAKTDVQRSCSRTTADRMDDGTLFRIVGPRGLVLMSDASHVSDEIILVRRSRSSGLFPRPTFG